MGLRFGGVGWVEIRSVRWEKGHEHRVVPTYLDVQVRVPRAPAAAQAPRRVPFEEAADEGLRGRRQLVLAPGPDAGEAEGLAEDGEAEPLEVPVIEGQDTVHHLWASYRVCVHRGWMTVVVRMLQPSTTDLHITVLNLTS